MYTSFYINLWWLDLFIYTYYLLDVKNTFLYNVSVEWKSKGQDPLDWKSKIENKEVPM